MMREGAGPVLNRRRTERFTGRNAAERRRGAPARANGGSRMHGFPSRVSEVIRMLLSTSFWNCTRDRVDFGYVREGSGPLRHRASIRELLIALTAGPRRHVRRKVRC
jgi:hypothetical protein